MRIALTGPHGFLGKQVVSLLRADHQLTGIVRKGSRSPNSLTNYSEIEWEPEQEQYDPVDVLILCHAHIGRGQWADSIRLYESNVRFTEEVCNRYKGVYTIYVSSVSVYGSTGQCVNESTPPSPDTPYSISKLWGEVIAAKGRPCAIIRASSIYGPGMRNDTIIPRYVSQALTENSIDVWGDGSRMQNYVHVNDVAATISAAVDKWANGVLLATGTEEVSNLALAQMIAKETGASVKQTGSDDSRSFRADSQVTLSALGTGGKRIPFATGLADYIEWKRRQ